MHWRLIQDLLYYTKFFFVYWAKTKYQQKYKNKFYNKIMTTHNDIILIIQKKNYDMLEATCMFISQNSLGIILYGEK